MRRIQSLSAVTFFLVGIVALGALVAGLAVGRRVGNDILESASGAFYSFRHSLEFFY